MSRTIHLNDFSFKETVQKLIREAPSAIESIVETGTFDGRGSTRVFAATGLPVYTIECSEVNAARARNNLQEFGNVVVFHGYSLLYEDMVSHILSCTFEKGVHRDFAQHERENYLRELTYHTHPVVRSNLLPLLCRNTSRQIIFLDSAGAIGFLECSFVLQKLNEQQLASKIIILDDVDHIKHAGSVKLIKELGYDWVDCGRFGYSVMKKASNPVELEADLRE